MYIKTIDADNKKYVQIDSLISYFELVEKSLEGLPDMILLTKKMKDMFQSINNGTFPDWLKELNKK